MKYNFDNLHWQEFEVLSFKALQQLIAPGVHFIEGGNDKGRDILYEGRSSFNASLDGKWLFQVKHKSKNIDDKKLQNIYSRDLITELKKVFITNQLKIDNYFFGYK